MRARPVVYVNGRTGVRGLRARDVASWVALILQEEGRPGELSLTFVDTPTMASLNERYTGRVGTTDVLAFSQQEGYPPAPDPQLLGDVVVDRDQVRRQAREHGVPIQEELLRVVAHGVLHLVGFDHQRPHEERAMRSAEARYISLFSRRQESDATT